MTPGEPLHRIHVDVVRNRRTDRVAHDDCARVVHPAPDARVVAVRPRLRNAGICAIRHSCCRQGERLGIGEVPEKHGRRRSIQTGVAGRVFGVAWRVDEWQPARVGRRARVAVGVRQREAVTGRHVTTVEIWP